MIKKYPAKIVAIHNHIDGVYTLELESLGKPFKYEPGQFLHLAIDEYDPAAQWPESRCFSMQSAPSDELIKITYSVKGAFTREMASQLTNGCLVWLKLPYGDLFTQEHNKTNTVFIAGGTGITPYLSLFNDPYFKEYTNPTLYFGFREKKYDLYDRELTKAKEINGGLSIVKVNQSIEGFLSVDDILKNGAVSATYFISGPQPMISFFKKELSEKGVGADRILTDDWE